MDEPSTVPDDIDALTPALVSALMREAGEAFAVQSVDGERLSTEGGFAGRIARLSLGYNGKVGPPSLVAKFAATKPAVRQLLGRFGGYANEIHFYRAFKAASPIATPAFHGAMLSEDRTSFVLLLEDCRAARAGDQTLGATAAEAESVLSAIAAFHAHWWDKAVAGLQRPPQGLDIATLYRSAWPIFEQRFGAVLPSWLHEIGIDGAGPVGVLARQLAETPHTLVHGDLRLDNLLFDGPRPIFLDWQAITLGKGPLDVAYFCAGSLASHKLADIEALVRHYHRALGLAAYDYESCWRDFRRTVGWLWGRTVIAGAFLDFDEPAAHARFSVALARWVELADVCEIATLLRG